jgi:hypothetical protein
MLSCFVRSLNVVAISGERHSSIIEVAPAPCPLLKFKSPLPVTLIVVIQNGTIDGDGTMRSNKWWFDNRKMKIRESQDRLTKSSRTRWWGWTRKLWMSSLEWEKEERNQASNSRDRITQWRKMPADLRCENQSEHDLTTASQWLSPVLQLDSGHNHVMRIVITIFGVRRPSW